MTLSVGAMVGSTVDTYSALVFGFWTNFVHFLRRSGLKLRCSVSVFLQEEVCSADASVFGPRRDARTLKTGRCFYELHVAETSDDGQHFSPLTLELRPEFQVATSSRRFLDNTCCLRARVLNNHNNHNNNHNHHNYKQPQQPDSTSVRVSFCVTVRSCPVVDMVLHGDHGSTWRRRQRRLRSWWRHEQQSVAMALSAAAHHSFDKVAAGEKYDGLRAQKTDRAGEAANRALRRQKSNAVGDAVFFELFDEDTAGVRPEALAEPRPQERVQRHTVEHIVDFVRFAPMVQILDAPVPQMVEQLPDVVFDTLTPDPEQVIEVPKILLDDVPVRAAVRVTQLAEQLVEVPTIISFSSLQRIVEQNVAIPVPGGGRATRRCCSRTEFNSATVF